MTSAEIELTDIENKLKEMYATAHKELSKKWDAYMEKMAAKEQEFYKKAEQLEKSGASEKEMAALEEAFDQWEKNKAFNNDRYRNMVQQTAEGLSKANQRAVEYVNGRMPKIYSSTVNEEGKNIEGQVSGIRFDMVDEGTVAMLVKNGDLRLPAKKVDVPKDVAWNKKQINSQLMQGILQGEDIKTIARRLQSVTDTNEAAAVRNARTMTTGAENEGRMYTYRDAAKKGVKMKKVWMSTGDNRTRDSHRNMDGEEQDLEDTFSNGLMYPGDYRGDAAEVYNCRCTMTTRIIGFEANTVEKAKTEEKILKQNPVTREFTKVETPDQAVEVLKNLGFEDVIGNIGSIDQELFVSTVNALQKLDDRFHMIGQIRYNGGDTKSFIIKDSNSSAFAWVSNNTVKPAYMSVTLNANEFKNKKELVTNLVSNIVSGHFITPTIQASELDTYVITHEYGHIVQNIAVNRRLEKLGAIKEVYGSDKEYKKAENIVKKERAKTKEEILKIAQSQLEAEGYGKLSTREISIQCMSEYGRKNESEFFAEAFAAMNLSNNHPIGNAMKVWLESEGI